MYNLCKRWGVYGFVAALVVVLGQFTYLLPVHIAAFLVAIIGVIVADAQAVWWVIKRKVYLPAKRVVFLHSLIFIALIISIVSGLLMFWPVREFLLYETSFQIKIVFVIALCINSFFIGRHMHLPSQRTFSELTTRERIPLMVSGAVSTASWIGTVIASLSLPL